MTCQPNIREVRLHDTQRARSPVQPNLMQHSQHGNVGLAGTRGRTHQHVLHV